MPQKNPCSWNIQIFSKIKKAYNNNKLAHALLFYVPSQWCIETLIGDICSLLLNTKIKLTHYHPDIHVIKNNYGQINLDHLNNIIKKIYLTSTGAKAKIVLLSPLESLNTSAANSLLKSLEAPPNNTYFILISYQLNWVETTLKSRSQIITVNFSEQDKSYYLQQKYKMDAISCQKALRISRGVLSIIDKIKKDRKFWILRKNIFETIAHKRKPLKISIEIKKHYSDSLYWLTSFIIDAYYLAVNLPTKNLANIDCISLLQYFIKKKSTVEIYQYYKQLLMLKDYYGCHLNINKELALETLLLNLTV